MFHIKAVFQHVLIHTHPENQDVVKLKVKKLKPRQLGISLMIDKTELQRTKKRLKMNKLKSAKQEVVKMS